MAHPDLHELLNVLLPFAKQQITRRGGFLPFGASMSTKGEVRLAMSSPAGDAPTPTECLDTMHDAFRKQAAASEIRASAVCWTASVTLNEEPSDAITIGLEHLDGEAVNVYMPYRKRLLRGHKFGRLVAGPREPMVFRDPGRTSPP